LWNAVFNPAVTDRAGLRRYVISVTVFAWAVAWAGELANEIAFFVSWANCFREWSLTTVTVLLVAIPAAYAIGRAHLQLNSARCEAERLSRTDPLTGLANRRAFYRAATQLGDGGLAFIIADIDRFKHINDRYGHGVGDEVIKAVAARMQADLGDLGTVVRLGGEEFALLGVGRPVADIHARLQHFRQRVADEPVAVGEQSVYVTVSIGFVVRRDLDFDALYAAADKALYLAKSAGRDKVVDYDQAGDLPQTLTIK